MKLDFRAVTAALIYGLWALATFLHCAEFFRDRIRSIDLLTIVPEWRFFGTNPGRVDFHLLYRDRLATDDVTDWIEIPLILPRPWYAFLFNPRRRSAKALMDVVIQLSRQLTSGEGTIVVSVPYLAILQHVSAQPMTELSTHRQFLVLHTSADTDEATPELVLWSEMHALEPFTRF